MLALIVIAALYVYLTAPSVRCRKLEKQMPLWAAHRGKCIGSVHENSVSAFRNAVGHGCAIEMDVRLTGDGIPVVHHDDSLTDTHGIRQCISRMTWAELQKCFFPGTNEAVPTLGDALTEIDGQVPLLLEIKSGCNWRELAAKTVEQLKGYRGQILIQSFDPRVLMYFRRSAKQYPRGQLARDLKAQNGGNGRNTMKERFGAMLLGNFLSRPDFISYEFHGQKCLSFRLVKALYRVPSAAWTVKCEDEMKDALKHNSTIIFEGFEPKMEEKVP